MSRIYLKIPGNKRNIAKYNGAKWDEDYQKWYVDGITNRIDIPDSLKPYFEGSLDNDDIISVGLYGGRDIFSSRSKFEPKIARIVRCAKADICPSAKNGRCAAIVSTKSANCPNATHCAIRQEPKDKNFDQRIKQHPKFDALEPIYHPHFVLIADDSAIMHIGFLGLKFDPEHKLDSSMFPPKRMKSDDDIAISSRDHWDNDIVLPLKKLTPDVLHEILTARPVNFGNYEIKDYRLKTVPRIMAEMSENWPSGYQAYAEAYPDDVKLKSHVGRIAYLSTCTQGSKWIDDKNREWILNDDKFVCNNFTEFISIFGIQKTSDNTIISMPVSEDQKIEITDDSQVNTNTKFA